MTNKQPSKKPLNKWIYFSQAALQMGVTIGICAYLGAWLDKLYPNKHSLFTVSCTLIGVFAGMYTIIKKALKMNNDET